MENSRKRKATNKKTVAIIGSAGRKDDSKKMNKENYQKMIAEAERIITEDWNIQWDNLEIISGGAAFSDHVAVDIFLKYSEKGLNLTLEMPCEWGKTRYIDNKPKDWKKNPGNISNYYHSVFGKATGKKPLDEIQQAIEKGAKITISKGFFDRNCSIAHSEYVIAFTFSESEPSSGGTGFTWSKFKDSTIKKHVCISSL
jgi:hypothetical protein